MTEHTSTSLHDLVIRIFATVSARPSQSHAAHGRGEFSLSPEFTEAGLTVLTD
jgi:hypothetical protein